MLSCAEKCLFMASSGDKAEMRWAWYVPNDDLAGNCGSFDDFFEQLDWLFGWVITGVEDPGMS